MISLIVFIADRADPARSPRAMTTIWLIAPIPRDHPAR